MPGFIATITNSKTGNQKTSDVDDLDAAKIRARTLRGVEKIEEHGDWDCSVTCPDGAVWRMENPVQGKPVVWKKAKK